MMMRTPTRSWNSRIVTIVSAIVFAMGLAVGASGCKNPTAILIRTTADAPVEYVDLYLRNDATKEIDFHSGWNSVTSVGATEARDITTNALKIALTLPAKGAFTLMMVGVIGARDGDKPAVGARQFFWAGRVNVGGTEEVRVHLFEVASGQDVDRDLFPNVATWLSTNAGAAMEFATKMDLLDCYDAAADMPKPAKGGKSVDASKINPFAKEICGDEVDEACDGEDPAETCQDVDGDGDPSGSDCDDNNPARHNPSAADPFPDPANCCGYNLGFARGTPDGQRSHADDPVLCPGGTPRCGDGIDNACKGIENNVANDTKCVIDADCDGFSPPQDCDDNDPMTYPGAPEPCGGTKDLNCSGKPNDGCVPCDLDGDGYQRNDGPNGCPNADDKNPGKFDCNDYDSSVFPDSTSKVLPTRTQSLGNSEGGGGSAVQRIESALRGYCRREYETTGLMGATPRVGSFAQVPGDFDCDGTAYKDCPSSACDADGDGFPNEGAGCAIAGIPPDCIDTDPTIFPGAPDKCGDGVSQNCVQDKACADDADGDGYAGADDCAPGDATRHPFAVEVCNGVDDDCDGLVDEGNPDTTGKPLVEAGAVISCTDSDIGECGKTRGTCVCSAASANSVKDPNGMMDACPTEIAATGATKDKCFAAGQPHKQSCNPADPKDDDCDGRNDDPTGTNLLILGQDCGSDTGECRMGKIIGCDSGQTSCFAALGSSFNPWIVCSTDAICPTAELCNGLDDDCDGATPTDEIDQDSDNYIACTTCASMTLRTGLLGCGDCLDTGATGGVAAVNIFPGQPELCDGVDNNCANGLSDDGATCPTGTAGAPGGHAACCADVSKAPSCRDLFAATETAHCTACNMGCTATRADRCSATGCVCGSMGTQCDGTNEQCMPPAGNINGAKACRKINGQACTMGDQCISGNCADGVCCNETCSGQCEACNRTGNLGICGQVTGAPVTGGTPARTACADTDGDGCDGRCSGSRTACTFPANAGNTPPNTGNMCPGASCQDVNTQRNPVTMCTGSGDCAGQTTTPCGGPSCACTGGTGNTCSQTVNTCTGTSCQPVVTSCGDFTCNGTACRTSCASDSDCAKVGVAGQKRYCDTSDGQCKTKMQPGRTCTGGAGECSSGNCNVNCCNSATTCAGSVCVAGTQSNQICAAIGAPTAGACTTSTMVMCDQFTCNGTTACNTACGCTNPPCNDSTHCISGAYCNAASGGTCLDKKANGQACSPATDGDQCESGNCQDNTCCNVASCGACGDCSSGTCAALGDGAASQGGACGNYLCGSGTDCPAAGSCAGSADCVASAYCATGGNCTADHATGACSAPDECTTGICATNCCTATCNAPCATGQCNGSGGCVASGDGATPGGAGCGLFLCGTGTACPTSCADDTDCVAGNYCAQNAGPGGTCKARIADDGACVPTDCEGSPCQICSTGARTCKDVDPGMGVNNQCAP